MTNENVKKLSEMFSQHNREMSVLQSNINLLESINNVNERSGYIRINARIISDQRVIAKLLQVLADTIEEDAKGLNLL